MLLAKFQHHRSLGSGEDFFEILAIHWHGDHVNKTYFTISMFAPNKIWL